MSAQTPFYISSPRSHAHLEGESALDDAVGLRRVNFWPKMERRWLRVFLAVKGQQSGQPENIRIY